MDPNHSTPDAAAPDHLPDLARDLARLGDPRIEVPQSVDDAVLAAARAALSRRRRGGRTALRLAAWTAAAAGLALTVWLGGVLTRTPVTREPAMSAANAVRGDLDGSGGVDILDAFTLARRLESGGDGTSPRVAGDFNGDGLVDRADVDAIAMAAVRLPAGAS